MRKPVFFILVLLLAACARLDPSLRKSSAEQFALKAGFSVTGLRAGNFELWSAERLQTATDDDLVVYIEGDGLAFRRRNRPSSDPTPLDYFTLQLAALEPASSVVYLARPCQYLSAEQLAACPQRYWTSHRYAREVVDAYHAALDQLSEQTGYERLTLVGYSGGGVIAALLAAERDDVDVLLTLAANLHLSAWTRHHKLPAMQHSLNPVDFADRLAGKSQRHFVGAKDDIVPPLVTESYRQRLGDSDSVRIHILPEYDHRCCWLDDWRRLRQQSSE